MLTEVTATGTEHSERKCCTVIHMFKLNEKTVKSHTAFHIMHKDFSCELRDVKNKSIISLFSKVEMKEQSGNQVSINCKRRYRNDTPYLLSKSEIV